MTFKQRLKSCFIILLTLASCGKSNNPNPTKTQAADVYAVGFSTTSKGVSVATYWKNGVRTFLADTTVSSQAMGIVVVNNNVYISGTINDPIYGSPIAVYWNNGTEIRLNDHITTSYGTAIAVSGGDIYVAGYNSGPGGTSNSVAEYWKNGVATLLTDGSAVCQAWSIAVNGTDVYVSGSAGYGGITYWKNGTVTSFTDGYAGGPARGIFFSGSDLYVLGFQNYWKNGIVTTIKFPSSFTLLATGITVNGPDVYIAGTLIPATGPCTAAYWKDNVAFPVTLDVTSSSGIAIATSGTDVYLAGFISSTFGASNVNGKAAYWKNGVVTKLSNSFSEVDGIAVVAH